MHRQIIAIACLSAAGAANANVFFADWTSNTTTGATGTVNGVGFTLEADNPGASFLPDTPIVGINSTDFLGADYDAVGEGNGEDVLDYNARSEFTINFDQPVGGVLLYARFWADDITGDATFTFDTPFSIADGFDGTSVSGNTLTIPQGLGFTGGVLAFEGTFDSLSLTDGALRSFRLFSTVAVVPAPGATAVLAFGALAATRRRRG